MSGTRVADPIVRTNAIDTVVVFETEARKLLDELCQFTYSLRDYTSMSRLLTNVIKVQKNAIELESTTTVTLEAGTRQMESILRDLSNRLDRFKQNQASIIPPEINNNSNIPVRRGSSG